MAKATSIILLGTFGTINPRMTKKSLSAFGGSLTIIRSSSTIMERRHFSSSQPFPKVIKQQPYFG